MLRIALTGGIGAGKSAVTTALAEHGAHVIDSDVLARVVVEPGTDGLAAVAHRFGPTVVTRKGALNRARLAAIVFNDVDALADLNEILHPLIRAESDRMEKAAFVDNPTGVVVHDIPLLHETAEASAFALTIVVETEKDVRLQRLQRRGLDVQEAQRRIDAQADDGQRRVIGDIVLTNNGTVGELRSQVRELWEKRLVLYAENLAASRPARRLPTVELRVMHAEWKAEAARQTARIQRAVGRDCVVHHIGSTAVPGVPARDIIDLHIEVPAVKDLANLEVRLAETGLIVVHDGANSDVAHDIPCDDARAMFACNADPMRPTNCYIRVRDANSKSAIVLRDWLRCHCEAQKEYAAVKRKTFQSLTYSAVTRRWREQSLGVALKWWRQQKSNEDLRNNTAISP